MIQWFYRKLNEQLKKVEFALTSMFNFYWKDMNSRDWSAKIRFTLLHFHNLAYQIQKSWILIFFGIENADICKWPASMIRRFVPIFPIT